MYKLTEQIANELKLNDSEKDILDNIVKIVSSNESVSFMCEVIKMGLPPVSAIVRKLESDIDFDSDDVNNLINCNPNCIERVIEEVLKDFGFEPVDNTNVALTLGFEPKRIKAGRLYKYDATKAKKVIALSIVSNDDGPIFD